MTDAYDLTESPEPPPRPIATVEPEPPRLAEGDFGLTTASPGVEAPARLVSLDAFRGFVMLAMASDGLGLGEVSRALPESPTWAFLARQVDHVAWRGCVPWDLIQPSFMFIVGVAMPWAYANRRARGEGWWTQFGHALVRAAVLFGLGVFLYSLQGPQTKWTFVNVLAQIGLGYPFVFLVLGWRPAWQGVAAGAILLGYWAFFAFAPLPGVEGTWPTTPTYASLPDHWAKNANAASDFDARWLNKLPSPDGSDVKVNGGGYATLNFVPSIATAIFGVLAGRLLKSSATGRRKLTTLVVAGLVGIAVGTILDQTGICPSVKRIWTPSWALVGGGWTCLLLAAFYGVVDLLGYRRIAWPLVVVGANSIAIYLMAELIKPFVLANLRTHLTTLSYVISRQVGPAYAPRIEPSGHLVPGPYGPIVGEAATLLVFWLICAWLYRRRIFIRI